MSEHRIELKDGRTLAVSETGDPESERAVVLCHPAPGSRVLDPDPAATAAAGVRLITLDRPGYGASTPLAAGTVPAIPTFAGDVVAALDHLGIDDVAAVGWSAGGRIALALAAAQPERVRAVAVVATPAPQEAVPWIPEEHLAMLEGLRPDLPSATPKLAEVMAGLAQMPPAAAAAQVTAGPEDDAALAADAGRRARLEAMMAEANVQGAVGIAADIVSYTLVDWGIDFGAVVAPTTLVYGANDQVTGPAHGEWYRSREPHAELVVVPGAGHLVGLTAWSDVLATLG
ncbi:MAG TPA: alpha/beta hydrolase [Acidimicrobiales bacterium]|jgi:pimeloyl-ACP methyl ester carboxylesterase